MRLRTVLFWLHVLTALAAGAVIVIMAVTGVLLAFEPQIVDFAERDLRTVPPATSDFPRKPLAALVDAAQESRGGERATTVTVRAEPQGSVRVGFGRDAALFMNPYSGAVIGPSSRTHDVMHVIEDWHRWLGSRDLARPITGACNLAFLGLAISGIYLWWPRAWTRRAVRAVAILDPRLRGRARDFNWHNSIGIWCAPLIVVLTLTGAVLSYQWANDLLYRLTGNEPPPPQQQDAGPGGARGGGQPREGERRRRTEAPALDLDALAARAAAQAPGWVAVTLRLPQRPGAPVTAFIQEPASWHPSPRSVLTLSAATAEVVKWEPFAGANLGRKLRAAVRVMHTGEIGGIPGQAIAGFASAGAAVLVWTGVSLAWRRLRSWSVRARTAAEPTDANVAST